MAGALSNPAMIGYFALCMARGYTKAQGVAAWKAFYNDADLLGAAGAMWDEMAASFDMIDKINLHPTLGTFCARCGQKVLLSNGRLLFHLGWIGSSGGRMEPCLAVGMVPAEVMT